MALKDTFQGGLVYPLIFDSFGVDDDDGAIFTNSQTIGDRTANVRRVSGVIQAVPLDEVKQMLFQLKPPARVGALAAHTDEYPPPSAGRGEIITGCHHQMSVAEGLLLGKIDCRHDKLCGILNLYA